jgi:hypothetical protein
MPQLAYSHDMALMTKTDDGGKEAGGVIVAILGDIHRQRNPSFLCPHYKLLSVDPVGHRAELSPINDTS